MCSESRPAKKGPREELKPEYPFPHGTGFYLWEDKDHIGMSPLLK